MRRESVGHLPSTLVPVGHTHNVQMERRVLLSVEMPGGSIPVTGDLLGSSWPIAEGPSPVRSVLHLPRSPSGDLAGMTGSDRALRCPQLVEEHAEQTSIWTGGDFPWGSVFGTHPVRGITAASVRQALIEITIPADDDTSDLLALISRSSGDWLRRLRGWAEALLEVDLDDAPLPIYAVMPLVSSLALEFKNDSLTSLPRLDPEEIPTIWITPGALDPETRVAKIDRQVFGALVKRANSGEALPLSHQILRNARAAEIRHDGRKAVIDAATACEIAMSEGIHGKLVDRNPQHVDRAIESANGLLGLYRLFRVVVGEIDRPTSSTLTKRVSEVRNSAAHRGASPGVDDVRRSIETAAELIQAIAPLHV